MLTLVEELRQGEVEACLDLRPGIHRSAKAGAARLTAERSSQARTPTKARGAAACLVVFDDREAIALATGLPEPLDWRMQKAFPGVGPHGIAE
jgi:hypothetical protein